MSRTISVFVVLAGMLCSAGETALGQWPTAEQYRYPSTSSQLPPAQEYSYPSTSDQLPLAQPYDYPTTRPQLSPPTGDYYPQPAPAATSAAPQSTRTYTAQLPEQIRPTPPEEIDTTQLPTASELAADDAGSWVLPTYWFNPVDWEGGAEVGVNGTEGNAEALSVRTGANLKRKTDTFELSSDVTYLKATADGVETQHNALQNAGYERFFGDHPWSFFIKESLEYDEFKAFDLRLAVNAGIGIKLIDTDATKLKARFGAGASREFGGPNNQWTPEALYGADFERQLTERQKLALTVDYFPEWGDLSNYRLVTDLGWEVLLDEAHNLNLKLSVNDRYDSTPNGRRPNDINYALLLLWKL